MKPSKPTEPDTIKPTSAEIYEPASCALPDCGAWLHMVITSDQPLYASFTSSDLAVPGGWDCAWEVRCENGHVVLLPPDNARDSQVFGQCFCEPGEEPDPDDSCGHGDMARLRKVVK